MARRRIEKHKPERQIKQNDLVHHIVDVFMDEGQMTGLVIAVSSTKAWVLWSKNGINTSVEQESLIDLIPMKLNE